MAKAEYQRLTRTHSRGMFAVVAVTRASLWLGADHLLVISTNGYTETYKRFYFRDIQSFVVQRTSAGTTVNVVVAILFTPLAAFGIASPEMSLKILFFSLAGILAVLALVNLMLGQTCRCFVRTAVQIEPLPPLNRVRRAQKVISRLRPLIAGAQGGELSAEMISDEMERPVHSAEAAADAVGGNSEVPPRLDP